VAEEVLSRAGSLADVIVGNDEEFGFMAGGVTRGSRRPANWPDQRRDRGLQDGPEGAITFFDGQEIRTGIYPVDALKPTGAGDSFMAGLLAGLSEGRDMRDAVLRGSACASIVVSRPGCAPAMPDTGSLRPSSHPIPARPIVEPRISRKDQYHAYRAL
jgi:5-dehydro-2-deoxygluconokinase